MQVRICPWKNRLDTWKTLLEPAPSSQSAIPLSAATAARAKIGVRAGFWTMSNFNLLSAAFNLVFPLLHFFVKLYIAQDLLLLPLISWKFLKSVENALAAGGRKEGKVPCEQRNQIILLV